MGSPQGLPGRKEQCMKRRFLLILVALVLALLCGCTQENTGRYDVEFRGERYTVDLDAGSITHKR